MDKKSLLLAVVAAGAAWWYLSKRNTAIAAAPVRRTMFSGSGAVPTVSLGNVTWPIAWMGQGDPVTPSSAVAGSDWISLQTGTGALTDLSLVSLEKANRISTYDPFGPAVNVDQTDPFGIANTFGFITRGM